jgi:hypothetical protein
MNPLAALTLLSLCILIFSASRRWAFLGLMAGVLYLSQYAGITVAGLNLFPTRVLELVLLARITTRREWSLFTLNAVDRAFIWLYVYTTVVFLVRSKVGQTFQVGAAVDAFLVYFSCRSLIDSPEEFRWILRSFVLLLIPFVLLVASESLTNGRSLAFTGWQPYGGFGARNDRIRCLGSFRHPSLLGTVSASFIPIFIGMAFRRLDRKRGVIGIALCLIIIWAANSGGPIGATIFGCLAWCCWRFRTKMRAVRWGIVGFVVLAAVLMKAPVWYLLDRVSAISGGDGWHRSYLLDITAQNLGQWWFAGMPVSDTASWFAYSLAIDPQADITNQFVSFGITAGLGALVLFILLFKAAFSMLGKALHAVRAASSQAGESEFLLWGLGCMLAAHIVNQFGITYFDQTYVLWFAQLAIISTISDWYLKNPSETVQEFQDEEVGLEVPDYAETTQ